jgi:tetratricopeptide (TPR) repeat protein
LEDAFSAGQDTPDLRDALRSFHYAQAQGYMSDAGRKPDPQTRIGHLNRIIQLGFNLGYIHKLLAEAYHELGDDETARAQLREAFAIEPQSDPQTMGAKRIAKALGLFQDRVETQTRPASSSTKPAITPLYTSSAHLPSLQQLQEWVAGSNWQAIKPFADLNAYHRKVLPRAREILQEIAIALGNCTEQWAPSVLRNMLHSHYWDVWRASVVSLAKIGNLDTLNILRSVQTMTGGDRQTLNEATAYLEARLQRYPLPTTGAMETHPAPVQAIMTEARQALAQRKYGLARAMFEYITHAQDSSTLTSSEIFFLLAQAAAGMGDPTAALSLVEGREDRFPRKLRREVRISMTQWLWSDLCFKTYAPINDARYLRAINIHLDLILDATSPHDALTHTRNLTRWLELLGERDLANALRDSIRNAAPGTWYVDRANRESYIKDIVQSDLLRRSLAQFGQTALAQVPGTLERLLHTP